METRKLATSELAEMPAVRLFFSSEGALVVAAFSVLVASGANSS